MVDMKRAKILMIIKGLKSNLPKEEMDRRYQERMPAFRDVPGLVQKFYSYDESTNEYAGIYFWDSQASVDAYLASDLRASIPSAYELIAKPVIETFPIVDILRS